MPDELPFSLAVTLVALAACMPAQAQTPLTLEHRVTLAASFDADQVAALSRTLPADREVTFRVRLPADVASPGVFVFISATDSGELPQPWAPVLDRAGLAWIAADGYGNSRPTAERMLVAVMALKLAGRLRSIDAQRRYVSGISGGGRVASQCITHFPQHFTGAFFIVGADYFMPREPQVAQLLTSRRLVFLTGSGDFNRREIRGVYRDYRQAGLNGLLLIDEDGFGHELANATQLGTAIGFLDEREALQPR